MRVLIDVKSRRELGAASYETEADYQRAIKTSKPFIEIFIGGCMHKVAVVHKPDLVRRQKPEGYVPHPPFFDPDTMKAPPLPSKQA
jgi:hypothetical protein